jgi:phosphoribosyl 1,2-cyclic phosphate phosphodiesterase
MPIYGTPDTLATIRERFIYVWQEGQQGGGKPNLELTPIEIGRPFDVADLHLLPLEVMHGTLPVTAFRFSERPGGAEAAYVTDCNAIGEETMRELGGLDLLVLDALGKNRHPTHFSLEQAVEVAERLAAKRTLFTHISHSLEHAETNTALPPMMALAFDGQTVELS